MSENLLRAAIADKEAAVIGEVADAEGVKLDFPAQTDRLWTRNCNAAEWKAPLGIGEGLKTKINANIGTSAEIFDQDIEVEKARIAEKYGADTVSDL